MRRVICVCLLLYIPLALYADHMPLHKRLQVYQELTKKPLAAEYEGQKQRDERYRQYYKQQFRVLPAQNYQNQLGVAEQVIKQQNAYREVHYRHSQNLEAIMQESQERYKKAVEQVHLTNQRLKENQLKYINEQIKLRSQGK